MKPRAAAGDRETRRSREDMLDQLARSSFDLLVIGAGINGAAVARDAVQRGLSVALLDKKDFGSGTSSRSSKLIHGGLRYLETFQFGLVRESTSERTVQMRLAPHLVRPVPFLFPNYKKHKHGLLFMDLGLWLYDALALFRVPRVHRAYRETQTMRRQPDLNPEGLVGSLFYYDCATDDGRLTLENVLDAASMGAVTLSYVEVESLLGSAKGRFTGAAVKDLFSGRSIEVKARLVISTAGPWTDALLGKLQSTHRRLMRPTQGSHMVFKKSRLSVDHALALISPSDGRPLFIIPWGDHTYAGTTDIDYEKDLESVFITKEEVDYILETLNDYFPSAKLDRGDVTGTWSGLRPLVDDPSAATTSRVSREHEILGGENGLLILVGGKLTTYRLMAGETVDRAVKLLRDQAALPDDLHPCRTAMRPLPGGVGLDARSGYRKRVAVLAERYSTTLELASHLLSIFGTRAGTVLEQASDDARSNVIQGLRHVWAEVDHAVVNEMAMTVSDVMIRRTLMGLKEARESASVAGKVAQRIAAHRGYDEDEQNRQVEAYNRWVEASTECLHLAK